MRSNIRNLLALHRLSALLLLVLLIACNNQQNESGVEHAPDNRFFAETGNCVRGEFLYFFEIYGGVNSLGYPLTEERIADGWRVQYFEKGRLEYHPENNPAYRVTVGWLGDLLNRRRPPIPPSNIPRSDEGDHRYYQQTGHTLSGDFLQYFETHGGSVRFGLPISEPYLLAGRLTQDFQSARFFWTPHNKETVVLEDIGRVHLDSISPPKTKR